MCRYLSHIADSVFQVELVENIQDPISRLLCRPSHEDFAEELPIKIGPPGGANQHGVSTWTGCGQGPRMGEDPGSMWGGAPPPTAQTRRD